MMMHQIWHLVSVIYLILMVLLAILQGRWLLSETSITHTVRLACLVNYFVSSVIDIIFAVIAL